MEVPPILGLQGIMAMLSTLTVNITVSSPREEGEGSGENTFGIDGDLGEKNSANGVYLERKINENSENSEQVFTENNRDLTVNSGEKNAENSIDFERKNICCSSDSAKKNAGIMEKDQLKGAVKCKDFRLFYAEVFLVFQHPAHGSGVFLLVRLGPERVNRRTFGTVQHSGLYKSPVYILSHLPSQGIQLPHRCWKTRKISL